MTRRQVAAALIIATAVATAVVGSAIAEHRPLDTPGTAARADAHRTTAARRSAQDTTKRREAAPNGPPLTSDQPSGETADAGEDDTSTSQAEADPLVSNGLGSPLCAKALGRAELSAARQTNCQTSGFVAAPAPTGNYGVDVHIDKGLFGVSSGVLSSVVQDLCVRYAWMALVWMVHALISGLEWCFTFDLLDSPSVGGEVGRDLRQMQSAFTNPWLATVLAIASVAAVYHGLVRRQVAHTVGHVVLSLAMMAAGMWVMLDPSGTVGVLGRWANNAGFGTLAVTTGGTPTRGARALADGVGTLFTTAIETPWCYMEFGDVDWCRNPRRLDPRLRRAGLGIAATEQAMVGCKLNNAYLFVCAAPGTAQARTLEHSATLLRNARSNGALFLALPANGPARNSINDGNSLLHAICQTSDAKHCRGPAAAQAEFRTGSGTWARVGGLLLIMAGVLGMSLLLGFIGLRLLAATLLSLLYLLLAPVAVLAPALGESGRAAFRRWGVQLLGAVVSKLLYSFLLGVVLAIVAILGDLQALGWWTQWLLVSAFWWGAFARRHQLLDTAGVVLGREQLAREHKISRRMSDALGVPRAAISEIKSRLAKPAPDQGPRDQATRVRLMQAKQLTDAQVRRTLEHDRREADASREDRGGLAMMRAQLQRVHTAHGSAAAGGDARRASELAHRAQRIEGEIARTQCDLHAEQRTLDGHDQVTGHPSGRVYRDLAAQRQWFLDAQAALPPGPHAPAGRADQRRDYTGLAGLAGYGRREYQRLDPGDQREARREIDRELALRKEVLAAAEQLVDGEGIQPTGRRVRRRASRMFIDTLETRLRQAVRAPVRIDARPELDARRSGRPGDVRSRGSGRAAESSVMRDAREVAARRKRQLGHDRQ